jgi:co-chaperonin GroES (HSP10)
MSPMFLPTDDVKVREMKPLGQRILVLLDVAKQASDSGLIVIPAQCQREQPHGVIVQAADDFPVPIDTSLSPRVIVQNDAGVLIWEDTKRRRSFVMYNIEDVIALVEE